MRIKKVVAAITAASCVYCNYSQYTICIRTAGTSMVVSTSLSGEKFVAVRDKEMRSLLKDSAKK